LKLVDTTIPEPGSADEQTLRTWKPKAKEDPPPLLSLPFRLKRAMRVIPITEQSIKESLAAFDIAVGRIEICVAKELQIGQVTLPGKRTPARSPPAKPATPKPTAPPSTERPSPACHDTKFDSPMIILESLFGVRLTLLCRLSSIPETFTSDEGAWLPGAFTIWWGCLDWTYQA